MSRIQSIVHKTYGSLCVHLFRDYEDGYIKLSFGKMPLNTVLPNTVYLLLQKGLIL